MQTLEDRIVAAARLWIGTRFAHQGRVKRTAAHKGGVDCLGLLAGVAAELDLRSLNGAPLASLDRADYGHLPDGKALKAALDACLIPVAVSKLRPGFILLLSPGDAPRHLGIVGEKNGALTLIHAYAQARAVAEHPLDAWWEKRIVAVYRVSQAQ